MSLMRIGHIIALLAFGLTSCSQQNSKICSGNYTSFDSEKASWSEKADKCIQEWAYRLALSSESSDRVADATMAACSMAV